MIPILSPFFICFHHACPYLCANYCNGPVPPERKNYELCPVNYELNVIVLLQAFHQVSQFAGYLFAAVGAGYQGKGFGKG